MIDAWAGGGLDFYRMGEDRVRLVTSFRSTPEEIDEALRRMASGASTLADAGFDVRDRALAPAPLDRVSGTVWWP